MDATKARGVFTRLRTQPDGVDPAVLDDGKHYYFLLERDSNSSAPSRSGALSVASASEWGDP